ncbi:hypothetical protein ACHHYP_06896 [Achlya hypogyna]|uniref:Mediator complex subunit 15 KIX domain-containing protein n=1 Tax=Achlya hypogyna TaxID=1202772 RepID=A0A1V9ZN16_ACHHY|nr:hypothetical protein ACHHYP_06896 [Achlya hypogyna]
MVACSPRPSMALHESLLQPPSAPSSPVADPAPEARSVAQHRQHYVRLLCRGVFKVHALLRTPFDKRTVVDTCRAVEESIYTANSGSFEAYVRQMRTRVQLIAKKGCAMVRSNSGHDEAVDEIPSLPTDVPAPSQELAATPEEATNIFQQAHIRYALCAAWRKGQHQQSRFRWSAAPVDTAEDTYVDSVAATARADILLSLRTMFSAPLAVYEDQLRTSLSQQHRDWVAYDLSVVTQLRAALADTGAHDVAVLHGQIQRVLKEKALFDYMWAMESTRA